MSGQDKLEKLLTEGFKDLKEDMKDIKADMKEVKEEINGVRTTANQNKKKIEDQAEQLADFEDQMKSLIASDQDLRRRAGRRYLLFPKILYDLNIKFRILVISGSGLPDYNVEEDIYTVAIDAISTITGLNLDKKDFHVVHRHGRYRERIFAE